MVGGLPTFESEHSLPTAPYLPPPLPGHPADGPLTPQWGGSGFHFKTRVRITLYS